MNSLEKGDFLYQADQELFLVVIDESPDSYTFAVHGWREIDKGRLDGYVNHENGKLYDEETISREVKRVNNSDITEKYEKLRDLFDVYKESDLSDDSVYASFKLDDT